MYQISREFRPLAGGLRLAALSLILLLFALPVVAADEKPAATHDQLKIQYDQALAAGDKAKALTLAEQMNDIIEPQHADVLMAIARLQAQLGNKEKAYEWLQRAADASYWNASDIRKDEAFAAFSGEERFKTLVRKVWAKAYIAMLERPERESFQKPGEVMKAMAYKPGERVADVGAGSGYFTVRVARAVEPGGTVLACDISQEMLDYLGMRVEYEKLANVTLKKVERDDPLLPPGGLDTILMVDTLHYVKDKPAYAQKLKAGLAPGGRVIVIDYIPKTMEERPWGPTPEQQFSRETLDAAMAAAGMKPVQVFDFLPEQYFVVYQVK
jgi:ubiquinone/menaquinone biosynthesis C-methylase UbiE